MSNANNVLAIVTISSSHASFEPTHILGPALKGLNASCDVAEMPDSFLQVCSPCSFCGIQRSGLNLAGPGKFSALRCNAKSETPTIVP